MGTFKNPEQISCNYYNAPSPCLFYSVELESGTNQAETKNEFTRILFLLEGELVIDCDAYQNRILKKHEIALLPIGCHTAVTARHDSSLIICCFSRMPQVCTRVQLTNLSRYKKDISYNYQILPFRGELPHYLSLLRLYLRSKVDCPRMHEGKLEELGILFRTYYSSEELVAFLYPIISENEEFNQFVLTNYKLVSSVEELAEKANVSISAFNRKFRRYFNESASRWMRKKRAEGVLQDIKATNKPFQEISLDWKFSSQAHLTKFCKQHYGSPPSEIRNQIRNHVSL